MKKIFIIALAAFASAAYAQQKPAAKPAQKQAQPAVAATPAVQSDKEKLLIKAWKVVSIEQFGVASKPTDKQKSDGVTFMADGLAFLTIDGVAKTGKWTLDKGKTYVTIQVDDSTEKFRFKIMNLTADQFFYEYQDPELVRIKYTCEPLKK